HPARTNLTLPVGLHKQKGAERHLKALIGLGFYFFSESLISRSHSTSSGGGSGTASAAAALATVARIRCIILTVHNTTKASKMKLIKMVRKLPHDKTTAPAAFRASRVSGPVKPSGVRKTVNWLVKSPSPPRMKLMTGMTMSFTSESII